jgi:Tol biopolymer transport system component
MAGPSFLALDSKSKRLFVLAGSEALQEGSQDGRTDLLWFDKNAREFRPFLPGISATDVDFSRDGEWIAYVRVTDRSLWVSRGDGTDARQITNPESDLELPKWSPDGRSIAFMATDADKPWRIYVVSADGGKPREATVGTDSQGAPTWSRDSKWLVYGNVQCQEAGNCAIHKIDLATGQEFSVPGSEGLSTARWSPDGRYIAALDSERHEVLAFDSLTERWQKMADGVNGNDLSWSADSRYIFASRPAGDQPEILRISLKDAQAETAVDLSSFAKLTGRIDTWFALAPDGSIILLRTLNANEIYSVAFEDE